MAKTIAFIDNIDEVEIFLETFKLYTDGDTIYIAGDALVLATLKNNGIECKPLDDYRSQKEYKEAEYSAVDLAGKWFVDNGGNDLTEFEDISIGNCLKKETFSYFIYLHKAILDVLNILKHENPEKVMLLSHNALSNDLFGEDHLSLHKKVFQFLKKDNKYDIYIGEARAHRSFLKLKNIFRQLRFKRHVLAGKITYYCPVILNRFIKKLVIIIVDQVKKALQKNAGNSDSVRVLVLSASDLTYFGNDLVKSYLRKGNSYLYYFEDENNCYFNSRILRVSTIGIASLLESNKISKYVSDLKFRFEKEIDFQRKHPGWLFMDLPLFNLIDGYLRKIIEIRIPELIKFLQISEYTIKKKNINIVLICERWGAKRVILSQIAKRNGLSVLHIPHSVEPGIKVGGKIISPIPCDIKYFPFYPTHEISTLKYNQQLQECRGIGQNKLFLAGVPRFGNANKKTRKDHDSARKRLGFSCDEEIVLFAIRAIFRPDYDKLMRSQVIFTFELSYFYESILRMFSKRKNSRAVFKLKMLDITDLLINDLMARNGINKISMFRDNLHDLLIASDAVVIINSNVGIEAMYCNTPVIVYNNPNYPSLSPLCSEKAAIEIKSPKELTPVLDRLRNDKSFKEKRLKIQGNFLQRNLPNNELTSSERISDVIVQLVKEHKKIASS